MSVLLNSLGIRSIMNLQEPEEHNNCGCPLEHSGFTYDPGVFMDNGSKLYYTTVPVSYGDLVSLLTVWVLCCSVGLYLTTECLTDLSVPFLHRVSINSPPPSF